LSIPLLKTRVGGSLKIFQNPTLKQKEELDIGKYLDDSLVSKNLPLFPKISLKSI
jgi:hypothetical protein